MIVIKSKYSYQKEAIINNLKSRCDHPSAEEIYEELKSLYPQLSLGTVYRNLSKLSESGEILRLTNSDSPDRFDGNNKPHYHLCCDKCNRVYDIFTEIIGINEMAQKVTEAKITHHKIMFYGVCKKCLNNI